MALGPVELVEIGFPDNNFHGEIAPALAELVESDTIRIIDFVFITKNSSGEIARIEISELDAADLAAVDSLTDGIGGLLSEEDLDQLGSELAPNSSAMIMLFENIWANRFASAVRNAGGQVLLAERIAHEAIEAAEAYTA